MDNKITKIKNISYHKRFLNKTKSKFTGTDVLSQSKVNYNTMYNVKMLD